MDEYLTYQDVADRLKVSARWVRLLVAEGRIKPVRLGRKVRITPAAVDEFIARENKVSE